MERNAVHVWPYNRRIQTKHDDDDGYYMPYDIWNHTMSFITNVIKNSYQVHGACKITSEMISNTMYVWS